MEFRELVKKRRTEIGATLEEVAKIVGVSKATVQRWESGEIKNVRRDKIANLAKALKTTPAFLMGWEEDVNDVYQYDNIYPIQTQKIRMIGEIACGQPIFANEEFDSYVECGADIRADFCVKARGDSMINARIHDGDIVFIREQQDVENGEIAAVIIEDTVTLKRVYKKPNSVVLMPENTAHEPQVYTGIDLEQFRILGKAVAFQSDII